VPRADAAIRQYAGAALAYLGDGAAFEQNLRLMIEQFGSLNDPTTLDRVVKSSLLVADATSDPKPLLTRIERALAGKPDANLCAWLNLTKMLGLYRIGNFQSCIEATENVKGPIDNRARTTTADLLKAMALQRLGQVQQARDLLVGAEGRMDEGFRKPLGIGGDEESWLTYQVFRREANKIIRPGGSSNEPNY
jgi:hypothetical protein